MEFLHRAYSEWWPTLVTVPVNYVITEEWEAELVAKGWPAPRGLFHGLWSVVLGQVIEIHSTLITQVIVFCYYYARLHFMTSKTIQFRVPPPSTLHEDLKSHLTSPEIIMVFGYLIGVWMLDLLPVTYYNTEARVSWLNVLFQFLVVDFLTFVSHIIEHNWPTFYKYSHKAHHVFTNPKLYNAFNASALDVVALILIPLGLTNQICHVSNWDLVAFGTLYAAQFTLIHCEFPHPWDPMLDWLGVGTAEDHNVHHFLWKFNYGHFFQYFDRLAGTYRPPHTVRGFRSSGQPLKKDSVEPKASIEPRQ